MRINREELLRALESVLPGLSPREIVEQSSCFVFTNDRVVTYNDEIACSHETKLKITGAIQATPLISLLRKLEEEIIEIKVGDGEINIIGKRRKAGVRMEREVLLPVDQVEKPGKWIPLPKKFTDAVNIVQHCSGTDDSQFSLTCVHIHPKWIEACDNEQISRYKIKTGMEKSMLVRRDAIKHIVILDATEFSETENWMHFRNNTGLMLSCRRYLEEYPNMNKVLQVEGNEIQFPKSLREAIERAEIFSREGADDDKIKVQLQPGKIKVTGMGASGWFSEIKKTKFSGKPIQFMISPKLFIRLIEEYNTCIVSPERLKVDTGKFIYVTALGVI